MINLNTLMAGGLGLGLSTCFSQIRTLVSQIRSFVIAVSTFCVCDEVFILWLKSKRGIDFGDSEYSIYEEVENTSGRKIVNYLHQFRKKTFIRFTPFPVFVSCINGRIKIIHLKYLTSSRKISKELFDIYSSLSKRYSSESEPLNTGSKSSYVFTMSGRLGSEGNHASPNNESSEKTLLPTGLQTTNEAGESGEVKHGTIISSDIERKYSNILNEEKFLDKNSNPFDGLYYNQEVLKNLEEIKSWLSLKTWYYNRQIAWKRGIALYGKPGTGKSSFVRAVGRQFGMDVYSFNLATFSDSEFMRTVISIINGTTPKILLFEDIDVFFKERKNQNSNMRETPLTFSTFLNTLDGVKPLDGSLIFITTNHLEDLDPALLRPGRIDKIIELKGLAKEGKLKIAEFILQEWPDIVSALVESVPEDISGAEFKKICIEKALELKWKEGRK